MKALFTFLFVAFFNLVTFAQAPAVKPFTPGCTVGLKVGINFASVSALVNSGMYLGWHGGVAGEFRPQEELGYSGEILFTNQGVTVNNIDFGLNYVTLPLGLNYHTGKATLQGGGYGAFLLKANSRQFLEKQDITGKFSGTDFGLFYGIKLQTSEKLSTGARYCVGLHDINESFVKAGGTTLYNRNVQVFVSYGF